MRRRVICLLIVLAALVTGVAVPASAGRSQPTVVGSDPANWTPKAPPLRRFVQLVDTYAQVGLTMYAGGRVKHVTSASGKVVINPHNLFRFNAKTGALDTSWLPDVDGRVWKLVAANSSVLYVAGAFAHVDGYYRKGIARIDLSTGKVDPAFKPMVNGAVTDARIVDNRLIITGDFTEVGHQPRSGIAALDPATGAALPYLRMQVTGHIPYSGPTEVFRFAVNPARTRMVVLGNFLGINGYARRQAAMINLGPTYATMARWHSDLFDLSCTKPYPFYTRDVDWTPAGGSFVIAGTGGAKAHTLCDSVSRWADDPSNAHATPMWVNFTGGDTLNSVAATQSTVYISGHERWANNPPTPGVPCVRPDGTMGTAGFNCKGPSAVNRPGIGALSLATGRTLAWNPTRDRGMGSWELYLTAAGLWVGSDTKYGSYRLGHENHPCIGFLPLP